MRIRAAAPPSTATPTATAIVHPPLTSVTPTDQTGIVAILSGFSLGLILLSILVRLYARRNAGTQRCDGYAFYLAAVFAIGEVSTTLFLISSGLGKSVDLLDAEALVMVRDGELATSLLYITTLWLSKLSCGLIIVWLTPFAAQKRVMWGLIVASTVWAISSLFAEGFGCRDLHGQCGGYRARWLYISVSDALLETALVGSSIYMVWRRTMSSRAKYTVVGAFSCRLPNILITLARLVFLYVAASTSAIHIARVQAATQLAVGYTVVSCVIPYLKPLMQSYEDDGPRRTGSHEATFKLSDRSKRSGSGDIGEGKGKSKAVGLELNDTGALLGPERPGFVRLKSAEMVCNRDAI